MQARSIKVGQQYLVRLGSSAERTLVTVVAKHVTQCSYSAAGCSRGFKLTTCTVRDAHRVYSEGVQARDLFELSVATCDDRVSRDERRAGA